MEENNIQSMKPTRSLEDLGVYLERLEGLHPDLGLIQKINEGKAIVEWGEADPKGVPKFIKIVDAKDEKVIFYEDVEGLSNLEDVKSNKATKTASGYF